MAFSKKPRILIGLCDVTGYGGRLNQGFKKLGIKSILLSLSDSPYNFGIDHKNLLIVFFKHALAKNRNSAKRNVFSKIYWKVLLKFSKAALFFWALASYDVFIFIYASSFFDFRDLPILKLFGKKIIYIFIGSDIRPDYLSGKQIKMAMENNNVLNLQTLYDNALYRKNLIRTVEKYSDLIVSHPAYAQLQTGSFVSFLKIGIPFKTRGEVLTDNNAKGKDAVRILHAPTFPPAKGTNELKGIIGRLKDKGYDVEYVEITDMPNSAVLKEIEKCDFVLDEIYSDSPLGMLGTEAAFFGKPTVLSGYYSTFVGRDYPASAIPPSLYCMPDEIESAVEKLIVDREFRIELGAKARKFVEEEWEASRVAERYLKLIKEDFPKDWFFDCENLDYLYGYGISQGNLKDALREYIGEFGIDALQLSDKENLRKRIMEFIQK